MTLFSFFRGLWLRLFGKSASKSGTSVLCVGMQNSSKYGACPGAALDSSRMAKLLGSYGKTVLLQNSQATTAFVKSEMEHAVQSDLAIIFYSGHGGRVRNPKAQDGSGYSEHLCLNNGPMYDFTIWDVISKAKGRVVLIFDCCHSATMHRSATDVAEPVQIGDECAEDHWTPAPFTFRMLQGMAKRASAGGILVWAGCPADNYSYGDDSGGVLTNGILKAFHKDRTYDEVWRKAARLASGQGPCRTVVGSGFGGLVFR